MSGAACGPGTEVLLPPAHAIVTSGADASSTAPATTIHWLSRTRRYRSELGVRGRPEDDVGDGRYILLKLWVCGQRLPVGVFAERAPRRVACRHVGEGEHVSQARHLRTDHRLTEEHRREARPAEDRHLAGVEHLEL